MSPYPGTKFQKMMEITTSWHEKGRAEGRMEGRTEGIIKGKLETARNMILEGMAVSLIVKVTGLPETEIVKLRQELKTSNH